MCVCVDTRVCVYSGLVAVDLCAVGLETHCKFQTAPLPVTMWWRPGLGKGLLAQVGVAIPPEYSLHKKAQSGTKLLS